MAFGHLGRALGHRNYRLFFTGQSVSLVGTWLTRVAMGWVAYRLTGSAFVLGLVGFVGQAPTFFLAPMAGVWVDRLNRHRVLVITQIAAMVQSALLALFSFAGTMRVAHLLGLGLLQGCINAFDMPARQAFVSQMVEDRSDLPNAIALNSAMVNVARLLGPSLAGVLLASVGEGWCFLIDAVSYLAVIGSLLAMRIRHVPRPGRQHLLTELREGVRYVATFAPIRALLLMLAAVSLVGMPYTVLMPIFATRILAGGARTLGFLMAASGLGALLGTLYLASRKSVLGLGRIIGLAATGFGVALIAFSLSRTLWVSLLLLVLTGAAMIVHMAASNTVVQTLVDEDKRGRVMSFYAMAFVGTAPFGSLLAGSAAAHLGAPFTLMLCGAVCLISAALFFRVLPRLRQHARPTYERLGILPPLSAAMDSTTNLTTPPE